MNKQKSKEMNIAILDYKSRELGFYDFQDMVDTEPNEADELSQKVYDIELNDKYALLKKIRKSNQ